MKIFRRRFAAASCLAIMSAAPLTAAAQRPNDLGLRRLFLRDDPGSGGYRASIIFEESDGGGRLRGMTRPAARLGRGPLVMRPGGTEVACVGFMPYWLADACGQPTTGLSADLGDRLSGLGLYVRGANLADAPARADSLPAAGSEVLGSGGPRTVFAGLQLRWGPQSPSF
ncbi:MAG: hypothetical protein WC943_04990 [Elusimicrobiota bacterium]